MKTFETVYFFEVFRLLEQGKDVFIMDKESKVIHRAAELPAWKLVKIIAEENKNNQYCAWIEKEVGEIKNAEN